MNLGGLAVLAHCVACSPPLKLVLLEETQELLSVTGCDAMGLTTVFSLSAPSSLCYIIDWTSSNRSIGKTPDVVVIRLSILSVFNLSLWWRRSDLSSHARVSRGYQLVYDMQGIVPGAYGPVFIRSQ